MKFNISSLSWELPTQIHQIIDCQWGWLLLLCCCRQFLQDIPFHSQLKHYLILHVSLWKHQMHFHQDIFHYPWKPLRKQIFKKIRIMFISFKISQYKNSHQSHYCWIHRIRKKSSKRLLRDQNLTPHNNKILLINIEKDKTTKKRRSYLPMGGVIK